LTASATKPTVSILGLPEIPRCEAATAAFYSRLAMAVEKYLEATGVSSVNIQLTTESVKEEVASNSTGKQTKRDPDELTVEQRAEQYASSTPLFTIEQLVVPEDVSAELQLAIHAIRVEPIVYDEWGLRELEPFPRSALSFHGEPGTGKTLAAHAVASKLSKSILVASYAQIESKFHGDGPKNVEALFYAAQRDNAVLFIDEADSLLSRRLTNVTQGSEQAINSMRSQLLICLEKFHGVVIFATNLVENYDQAFETRVRHIYFPMPNVDAREAIWRNHLPAKMPISEDVSVYHLARYACEMCGRDIKNVVIKAATQAAIEGKQVVTQDELMRAVNSIVSAKQLLRTKSDNIETLIVSDADDELKNRITKAVMDTNQRQPEPA
jgi:AAA+ superfamily predicted ATPase